ncbi:unnamed protein product [Allacma fusca]|uniref:PDZ domain-containing protein n=1 Tax=Allacma fusca TaxID=39272 RepID=A0A8J2LSL0_9HEXA|nr:unnamed protein product [Allacma fusca]
MLLIQSIPTILKSKKSSSSEVQSVNGGSSNNNNNNKKKKERGGDHTSIIKRESKKDRETSSNPHPTSIINSPSKSKEKSKKKVVVNGSSTIGRTSNVQSVDIRGRPIVRKKWRPLSYAEPGAHSSSSNNNNNNSSNSSSQHHHQPHLISSHRDVPVLSNHGTSNGHSSGTTTASGGNSSTATKGRRSIHSTNSISVFNGGISIHHQAEETSAAITNGHNSENEILELSQADEALLRSYYSNNGMTMSSRTYNGHSVIDLEARLSRLRVQQLARRKSVDFAISCVEPDPTCFSVDSDDLDDDQMFGDEHLAMVEGVGQDRLGIYIKSVVNGGSADMDGRLGPGDQLLSVDGQSLVGITQEKAAEYLVRTGPVVTLEVAKQAAIYQGLATMLSQPSPVMSRAGGASQQRRMSERDLPSKVLREQNQDLESHHPSSHHSMLQPRIHSSKSVPSLNSERDHHPIPMSNSIGPGMLSPNVMAGSTGGTGGNPNMPQGIQANVIRSPGGGGGPFHSHLHGHGGSSHHDPNMRPYTQGGYPLNSMTMQPHSKSHMGPSMDLRSRSIQSLADPPTSSSANHIGMKQPSTPSLHLQSSAGGNGEDERYYQNVGFYPPPPPPPNPNPANMPLRTYIPYSNSSGNIPGGAPTSHLPNSSSMPQFRPAPGGGSYRGPPPNLNTNSAANLNWQRQQQQQQQQMGISQQQIGMNQQQIGLHRDLMRQEAKMLEMQDELRRREERAALMMTKAQQQQNRFTPRFTYTPTPPGQQQMNAHLAQRLGPPSVPSKPYRPDSLHGAPDGPSMGPGRPPLPEEFKFSSGDLPRGTFAYNGLMAKPLGGNPWETAEKEREALRRKEMARFWRDQQIQELESLPNRNPSQDEQLRALRLEREFQRRAEEIRMEDDGEGDDDEEEEDERKAMVRRVQEDLERTRISSGSLSINHASNGNKLDQSMEEERARKIEEMRRKKLELEAAQAAEERLVREATRRREEELRRQQSQMIQHQQQQQQQQQIHMQQQQQQSYHQNYRSSYPAGGNGTHPPVATPEKLSPVTPPQSSPRQKGEKKSVSFNETVATNEVSSPVDSPPTDRVREDPNRFLSEATALLASPRSPDGTSPGGALNTPGVIGAQEVYRDPRWRRLQEQQQKQQAANAPKPEKLTFKEKMKMFAMESGEDQTPKEKVKSSKAQREIETPITPIVSNK